jgi:CHAT domain-containing protein
MVLRLLRGVLARTEAAQAAYAAELAQKAGDGTRFRNLSAYACTVLIRLAGVEPAFASRPHPGDFTDALVRLAGADHIALCRAGGLYAVALDHAGDYGQCLGFGLPVLSVIRSLTTPKDRVSLGELLAALGDAYRWLDQPDKAAICDQEWDALEAEIQKATSAPPWLVAMSDADLHWMAGRSEAAIATLTMEIDAQTTRRGASARQAAPWVALMEAMRGSFQALRARDPDAALAAARREAEAAWRVGEASYDLAAHLLLGRAQSVLDWGTDPAKVRPSACRALVFARDVRNKQALRWQVLEMLWLSARSSAERVLLGKLAVGEVLSLRADLSELDATLGGTEEGRLARLFAKLVADLVTEGRLAEASFVMSLRRQKEVLPERTDLRGSQAYEDALLVGPEQGAAMIYYAARNSDEPSRAEALLAEMGAFIAEAVRAADSGAPGPALEGLQDQLGASDALLQVMPGAEETRVIVHTARRTLSFKANISARRINEWVFDALRKIEAGATMAELPELAELHAHLVAPWFAAMAEDGASRLVVAASGPLQTLPWGTLHDTTRWLIEDVSICRAASESRAKPPRGPGSPQIFIGGTGRGVEGRVAPIDVTRELEGLCEIARRVGEVTFAPEADFTRECLLAAMRTHDLVSVSAHCLLDPLSPRQSKLLLGDGSSISLELLADAPTTCDLVILSACDTGRSGAALQPGSDVAIDRLLIRSGARAVVSTAWRVDNVSHTELMLSLFDQLLGEGAPPDIALASAQRAMIRGAVVADDSAEDWSSPCYWAAPMLTGDWEPTTQRWLGVTAGRDRPPGN